ncbi:MAG: ABC transporter substrate-binding protein [Dehalococcoidales bacterium]|nr:ABC transporter substrate-binding protein [Dehalococcoidales bacterium]
MKRETVWLMVSCMVVLSMVLSACAPAAPTTPTSPATPTAPTTPVTPTTPATSTTPTTPTTPGVEMVQDSLGRTVEKPRYGGTFTIALDQDTRNLDATLEHPYNTETLTLTHERFTIGDFLKGPLGTEEVSWWGSVDIVEFYVGKLAESWEFVDNETLVFNIRKGIHWALDPGNEASRLVAGRELTADDVVFALERMYRHPKSWALPRTHEEERPVSITAPDKYAVVLKSKPGLESGAYLMAELPLGMFQMTNPPETYQKYGDDVMKDWRNHVGTGPFMITDYLPGSAATFIRNPNYWGKHPLFPEDTMPYIDGVKFLIIPDLSTRMAALRTAKIDHSGGGKSPVPLEQAEPLLRTTPIEAMPIIIRSPEALRFKVNDPALPSYDVRVRQAIALAIDQPTIMQDMYGGRSTLPNYPIMPNLEYMGMHTSLEELPASVRELFEYHPDKAKQLLTEAGYPNGLKIEVVTMAPYVDNLSVLKDQLSKVGVELVIDVKERGVFLSLTQARNQNNAAFTTVTSISPFAFQYFAPDDLPNINGINDPVANEAWEKFKPLAISDRPAAEAILKPFFAYALEQAWNIEFPAPHSFYMWWPWVKLHNGDVSLGRSTNHHFIQYIWIDQELKKSMGY